MWLVGEYKNVQNQSNDSDLYLSNVVLNSTGKELSCHFNVQKINRISLQATLYSKILASDIGDVEWNRGF
jgi:hypothetical protein